MMTVKEVSELTGVSVRTLQYYDRIGLLTPAAHTGAGYRLYDEAALETLRQILLYRELQFPLKEIRRILHSPDFDRNKALRQQIELLTMRREHLENLILLAKGIAETGGRNMDFSAFDTSRLDEYSARARAQWGKTDEYREYAERSKDWTAEDTRAITDDFMQLFAAFGQMKENDPASDDAQKQVQKLRDYISGHFYTCSVKILSSLGQMYAGGGEFTENIDRVGSAGTAGFAAAAIAVYCERNRD